MNLLNVDHEDVVCILFQYTLQPKELSWFFSLQVDSILNLDGFAKAFLGKFGNHKTIATLMKDLLSMRMGDKEKVQEFNNILTTLLNRFSASTRLVKESLV